MKRSAAIFLACGVSLLNWTPPPRAEEAVQPGNAVALMQYWYGSIWKQERGHPGRRLPDPRRPA